MNCERVKCFRKLNVGRFPMTPLLKGRAGWRSPCLNERHGMAAVSPPKPSDEAEGVKPQLNEGSPRLQSEENHTLGG